MADFEEQLNKAQEHVNLAEGYMTDAEFREEHETRLVRYLQAVSHSMLALYLQNQVIIEMMTKQQDALRGRR
jgi:hypothetical protein